MADNRTALDPRGRAEAALAQMSGADFPNEAERLLDAIGYASDRRLPDQTGDPADFLASVPATQPKDALIAAADSVRLLFQVTDAEIAASAPQVRPGEFDSGVARSFLFIAAELRGDSYSRGDYAAFTREINKRFNIPAVVLFWTAAKRLTIAFVHRRPNKRDPNRDVIGSVSLIREINPLDGNRVWIDIVAALSLDARLRWMESRKEPRNFDGLLAAWLDDLGAQELNKQFYSELFAWFELACRQAKFPATGLKTLRPEEHVIRLITRLLFIWFIKEKGLVASELFTEAQVAPLLNDYDRDSGDSYYRAVLQNLFFATLNTEIAHRGFSGQTNQTHRDFSRYRYRDEMADPDRLTRIFDRTPFINGGLFDCLDSEDASGNGGWRIDCFTDNPSQRKDYSIPNRLFFGPGGVISLFEKYKFTVEENTPVEQDVALDPELLGKVFENLLAAYNPETRETARKQTGSYYTPREVVDYMVDEALIAALAQKVQPDDRDAKLWQERIGYLLDYGDAFEDANTLFTPAERAAIVDAIANLRVLDPAVGSGAFPMAILHKLTLALRRLDPDNLRWGSDFSRKLHLIQNAIYGVDIQTVACQIAKLRFFISLAIEQIPTADPARNYGVQPLPNLETRFVAANTLIARQRITDELPSRDVTRLRAELKANRERHFRAANRQEKLGFRHRDKELREELAEALRAADFSPDAAKKVAEWDPYDQNASADWFDPEDMFGVTGGFDVIIGNPPYINVENLPSPMRQYLFSAYETCEKRTDIYIAFMEKSLSILTGKGMLCFIIPASFTKQQYGAAMRKRLIEKHSIREIVDASSYRIFENAVVYNIVLTVANEKQNENSTKVRIHHSNADFEESAAIGFSIKQSVFASLQDYRLSATPSLSNDLLIQSKIWSKAVSLDQICLVAYGARLNHRSKPIGKSHYIHLSWTNAAKKFCEGRNIERYAFSQYGWLDYTPNEHYNPMFVELFETEKLMTINVVKDRLRFAYDKDGFYNSHTVINCVRLDLLQGVTNSTAARAVKARHCLASIFDYRFLMGILNSELTNWYFLKFMSENLHFYPNDAKKIPIPKASEEEQLPIIALVDKILDAKAADANADTSAEERAIDRLVYALYGLADDEVAAVESGAAAP